MTVNSIVSVTITTLTTSVSRAGFGTPLLLAYFPTSVFAERTRAYSSLSAMVSDGFATTHPAYLMAQALKAQNPSPPTWKVGRKASPSVQTMTVTPNSVVEGEVVRLTIEGTEITYTIPAAASFASIATALQPLINAVSGVTAVDSTGYVTITPTTANDLLSIGAFSLLTFKDNTPDPGIAADLAAVRLEDADWYGLAIDSGSEAEIKAAAAWAESNKILFIPSCIDSEIKDGAVSTDVGSDLQTAGYDRTGLLFTERNQQYGGCRFLGRMLPKDPGSATWAFKDLAGLDASVLTTAEETALVAKSVNRLQLVKGARVTLFGVASSGEYLDIMRGVDWFEARLQERLFALLVNSEKLPYSDSTGNLVRAEIQGQLEEAVDAGLLLPNTAETPHIIDIPLVANVSDANKLLRLLPDIEFSAKLAGAVHKMTLQGSLSV